MNYIAKFISIIVLGIVLFSFAKKNQDTSNPISVQNILDESQVNLALNFGLEQLKNAISLRDKLVQNGIDFNKVKHIPELENQYPVLAAYYREAAKTRTDKQADLEKILKQMEDEFKKKSMPLHKWSLFHEQLSMLFGDATYQFGYIPGKLNFKNPSYEMFSKSFPCFVYAHDGILGLQTLNLAFASDIMVLAMPTDKVLKADGIERTASEFVYHDAAHFSGFQNSPYAYDRFKSKSLELYHKIEAQTKVLDRIQDHLIFFMLIHEFYYTGSYYMDTFDKVLQSCTLSLLRNLAFGLDDGFDRNKKAIFNAIRYENVFEPESIRIDALNISDFLITGVPSDKSRAQRSIIATMTSEAGTKTVMFKNFEGKTVTSKDTGSQFGDLAPLIEMMEPASSAQGNLNPLREIKKYSRNFLLKYANLKA